MKLSVAAATILFSFIRASAEPAQPSIPLDHISVFSVPLVCPVAANIGCGSRAKPILLELEKQDGVAQAWLNREGTLLAVVWKPATKPRAGKGSVKLVLKREGLEGKELSSTARKTALSDFPAARAWLRGNDVDRLSEEEAGIMARRLMGKIRTIVTLTEEKATGLQEQIAHVIALRLTGQLPEGCSPREEILNVLQKQLSEGEVNRLKEALKDYRPNRDEP